MSDPYIPRRALVVPATDARNRALRTFLQGLAMDVLAALVLLLFPVVSGANDWSSFDWQILGFLAAKTVLVTLLSYVMRFFSIGKATLSEGDRANSV